MAVGAVFEGQRTGAVDGADQAAVFVVAEGGVVAVGAVFLQQAAQGVAVEAGGVARHFVGRVC